MKEPRLAISEFKAKCLHVLEEVAVQGKTVVITKRGRPLARVAPVEPKIASLRGVWKDVVKIKGDLVTFSVADDWDLNR